MLCTVIERWKDLLTRIRRESHRSDLDKHLALVEPVAEIPAGCPQGDGGGNLYHSFTGSKRLEQTRCEDGEKAGQPLPADRFTEHVDKDGVHSDHTEEEDYTLVALHINEPTKHIQEWSNTFKGGQTQSTVTEYIRCIKLKKASESVG